VVIMAKRKYTVNEEKWIKEKRGQGEGENYKPWLTIHDLPSLGTSSRLKGIKIKRKYELLSELESDYFRMLDFCNDVVDIREQYPLLDTELVEYISNKLGLKVPKNKRTGNTYILTTDFFIDYIDEYGNVEKMVRTVKPSNKLDSIRVMELFEIERLYFMEKGIHNWGIVTENEINKKYAKTIDDLSNYDNLKLVDGLSNFSEDYIANLLYEMVSELQLMQTTVADLCNQFDSKYGLYSGNSIAIFKHLLLNKIIAVDLYDGLNIKEITNVVLNYDATSEIKGIV